MKQPSRKIEIKTESAGKRRWTISALVDGKLVHIDTGEPSSEAFRRKYLKRLDAKIPDLSKKERRRIETALMIRVETYEGPPVDSGAELDVSTIVRPEQFFHAQVSGFALPVVRLADGKPTARWAHFLRWADGRREQRELRGSIELPDGNKLFVHPEPAEPTISAAPGWSASSRRRWLEGEQAPNPASLFRRLVARIDRYLALPDDQAEGTTATLALWSMLTYVFRCWDSVCYLHLGGALGSGKSTAFSVLSRLVFRPISSSSMKAPTLFRTLGDSGGVLILDEAERLKSNTPDQEEVLGMLLAGYRRGGCAVRLEATPDGKGFRPVSFDVFGPKALACIAGLPPALASRCIALTMFRAPPNSRKPKRRIDAKPEKWQSLRDDLHCLAIENGPTWLELARKSDVVPAGVNGRDFELWQPLLALASWIDDHGERGLLDRMKAHALDAIDNSRDDGVPDADEILLQILAERARKRETPTPGEILDKALVKDSAAFAKWSPRGVSARLSNYGFRAHRTNKRRLFRVSMKELARVQTCYGIDLGIPPKEPSPPSLRHRDAAKVTDEKRTGDAKGDAKRDGSKTRKHEDLRGKRASGDGGDGSPGGGGGVKKKRRGLESFNRHADRHPEPSRNGFTHVRSADGKLVLAPGWTEGTI
jgi:hypothetical protein